MAVALKDIKCSITAICRLLWGRWANLSQFIRRKQDTVYKSKLYIVKNV